MVHWNVRRAKSIAPGLLRAGLAASCVFAIIAMTPAAAQSFSAAPNASFVLDFDSEDGNFSLWRATDLTGINALRARATFVRKGQHRQWAPSFAISVGSEGADASISFTAAPRSGPLMVEAALWRGGEPSAEETFLLTPAFQEPFDIHVDWTEEGLVTFTVFSRAAQAVNGYERRQVNLGQAPTTVRITGSTGEVLFEPLQLGHVAR